MRILITGCSGFIGFSYAQFLLKNNKKIKIIGIDSIDNYYSVKLKKDRLDILKNFKKNFLFYKQNLKNKKKIENIFKKHKIDYVYHFAAQAGVRYSFSRPQKYIDSNILSFFNILELSRKFNIKKFFFASSSSIYGDTNKFPSNEKDMPLEKNLYAISKIFDEKIAKVYAQKYNMKIFAFRFFTVYGEWGRPDMFMIKYLRSAYTGKKFNLYNYGNHKRDFTYIKDVLKIIFKISNKTLEKNYDVFNICSSTPIHLQKIINLINKYSKKPKIIKKDRNFADVLNTHGSNKKIKNILGKIKFTSIDKGIHNLVKWFKIYYNF
jgi:UDP-glucuronate 4-epimerase